MRDLQTILTEGRATYNEVCPSAQDDMLLMDSGLALAELLKAEYDVDIADPRQAMPIIAVIEKASQIAGEMYQLTGDEKSGEWAFHTQLASLMRLAMWTHQDAQGVPDDEPS